MDSDRPFIRRFYEPEVNPERASRGQSLNQLLDLTVLSYEAMLSGTGPDEELQGALDTARDGALKFKKDELIQSFWGQSNAPAYDENGNFSPEAHNLLIYIPHSAQGVIEASYSAFDAIANSDQMRSSVPLKYRFLRAIGIGYEPSWEYREENLHTVDDLRAEISDYFLEYGDHTWQVKDLVENSIDVFGQRELRDFDAYAHAELIFRA